jgi:hypothetical protein
MVLRYYALIISWHVLEHGRSEETRLLAELELSDLAALGLRGQPNGTGLVAADLNDNYIMFNQIVSLRNVLPYQQNILRARMSLAVVVNMSIQTGRIEVATLTRAHG